MKFPFSPIKAFQIEYQHLGNFYPIALMIGILCAVQEISVVGILCLGCMAAVACCLRASRKVGILLGMIVLGYCLVVNRESKMTAPVLKESVQADVSGLVEEEKQTPDGQKIILSHVQFLNRRDLMPPERIELSLGQGVENLSEKSQVKISAFLRPPFSKMNKNGYDEGFHLKFQKIGAVGRGQKLLSQTKAPDESAVSRMRKAIKSHINAAVPEKEAEVLIPLSIGEQSRVSRETYRLFRSAGITHILSVSGFHLSLLAFFIFLLVRRIFALSPKAEYISNKKIAAFMALMAAIGYTLISGMQVPAIRSLIMIALVLWAVMWDRNALSVRSLAVAACCILAVYPELVFHIGFQLSFMAVLILTTLYPQVKNYIWPMKDIGFGGRFMRFILSFILLDFLMSLATTPFVIYYFNVYALYSLIGNMVIGTIISFWVMPLLFLALFLMPIGGDALILKLSGMGVEAVLSLCSYIQTWPHAVTFFPSFGAAALLMMAGGMGCLCLMKTKLRFMGIAIFMVGVLMAWREPEPDMMIGDFGQTIAVRTEKGLDFIAKGSRNFVAQNWLMQNGENPEKIIPQKKAPDLMTVNGFQIAFREESCKRADICFLDIPNSQDEKIYYLYEPEVRLIYLRGKKPKIVWLKSSRK